MIQGSGTRGNVGTYKDESLPNISGYLQSDMNHTGWLGLRGTGSFYQEGTVSNAAQTTSVASMQSDQGSTLYFKASRSSSTYQNDAPVQQNALLIQCCIKY